MWKPIHFPKIYLAATKILLSMYELKSPSTPDKSLIAKTLDDKYNHHIWYFYFAGVGCSWSMYLYGLYNACSQNQSTSGSLFLSKREIYGFVIAGLGHLLRIWSKYTMHRHFSYTVHVLKNHELIKSGPYSIVRHPGYVGDTLLWIGEFLITNSYMLLIANFYNVYVSLKRIPKEDNLLKEQFGDDYDEYQRKVKYALIPFVI